MSVKHQRRTNIRNSCGGSEVVKQAESEVLVCSPTTIKFNKKNINYLFLQCNCQVPPQKIQQKQQNDVRSSVGFEISNDSYTVQLDGSNTLHVIKNHVKHIFPFESQQFQKKQWVSIIFQKDHQVMVNSYGLIKLDKKIKLVKDAGAYMVEDEKCFAVKPLELLEQKMRLRALRMSKSQKKQINFSQTKKINILGSQKSPLNTSNSSFFNNSIHQSGQIELKKSIKKANISLALCDRTNFDVRGVEFKKSVEKQIKSPSVWKNDQNSCQKNSKYQKSLNTSKKHEERKYKNTENSTKNIKTKQSSHKKTQSNLLSKSQRVKDYEASINREDNISSTSYYTSKKSSASVFQFIDNEPVTESNLKNQQKSFTNLMVRNPKTEMKNSVRPIQSKGSFNLSTNPKSFSKNISQSKIMQVSRTLLIDKQKK